MSAPPNTAKECLERLLSGCAMFGVWCLIFKTRGGMGFGDVKLAGATGLVFGFPAAAVCCLAGCLAALLWALFTRKAVLCDKADQKKFKIPCGAFLCISAVVFLWAGRFL